MQSPGGNGQSRPEPGALHDYTDPDAPKTIKSKEISSFHYEFYTGSFSNNHDWGKYILHGYYFFTITRQEDSALCACEGLGGDDDFQIEFEVPISALDDLQAVVDAHELAKYNGKKRTADGIPPQLGFSLRVLYASGESIITYDNTGNHLSAVAVEDLFFFFYNLAKEAGEDFLHPEEIVKEFEEHIAGRWESLDDLYALEFDGNSLKIYGDDALIDDTTYSISFDKIYNTQTQSGFFTGYTMFEYRDGEVIGTREDGSEIVFWLSPSEQHE